MTIQRTASVNLPVIWATFEKIELLPYHELGNRQMGGNWVKNTNLDGAQTTEEETMERVKGIRAIRS